MNAFKSTLLLVTLTVFLIVVGYRFGGQNGMLLAFALSVVFNFGSYFYSDKLALAMYQAQPVTRAELPRAYEVVERLTAKQGVPMPKIYVLPTDSPNAFATGRNPQHASVAMTRGILQLLDDEELEGVLAHELGHIRNRDILTSSIAATLAGAITMVARMGYFASLFGGNGGRGQSRDGDRAGGIFMIILAPIAASLIQLAISRSREYEADATGAAPDRQPLRACPRIAEARQLLTTSSDASLALYGAPVHRGSPARRRRLRQPLLDAPTHQRAHHAADRPGSRLIAYVLRIVRLLTIVVWEGALLFFAFVLAPVAFHVLPSTHEAGLVVGGTLVLLHRIGGICGMLFLLATGALYFNRQGSHRRMYLIQIALVASMLAITAYLQRSVVPAMECDRAQAGGNMDAVLRNDPARRDFERLHSLSERLEGAVLFAGIGVVFLLAIEQPATRTIHS